MRNDGMISKADVRRPGSAAVTFNDVARENWERIFGTPEETARKRRAAIATAKSSSAPKPEAHHFPAVHGDKLFAGYDPALRMMIKGRTHRREVMKERGLRCAYD